MKDLDPGFEYVNARLRAMRTRLLSATTYDLLLASPTVEALIGRLEDTPYREALEQVLPTQRGVMAVLRALQQEYSTHLQRIHGFCGGSTATAWEILLTPITRHNVITLLRGVDARADPKWITASLVAIPPFSEAQLSELASQSTLRRLVELLAQWHLPSSTLADVLLEALFAEDEITKVEVHFEQAWAADMSDRATEMGGENGKLLSRDISLTLDVLNLARVLDWQGLQLEPQALWLPGGFLQPPDLERLRQASDAAAMLTVLAEVQPASLWQDDLQTWSGQRPADLQNAWERTLVRWQADLLHRADPLGTGVMIAYLAAKDTEIRNLRLIAQAVVGGISRSEANEKLLFLN